ncbi:hypothetical protein TMM008_05550 [Pseudomonas sp. 008]|nr:hypothetical protein TMM008_05550 [Pseudomonas sp. 008]
MVGDQYVGFLNGVLNERIVFRGLGLADLGPNPFPCAGLHPASSAVLLMLWAGATQCDHLGASLRIYRPPSN